MPPNPNQIQLQCANCDFVAGVIDVRVKISGNFLCPKCQKRFDYRGQGGQMQTHLADPATGSGRSTQADVVTAVNRPNRDSEQVAESVNLQHACAIIQKIRARSTDLVKSIKPTSLIPDDLELTSSTNSEKQKLQQLQTDLLKQLLELIQKQQAITAGQLSELASSLSAQTRELLQRKFDSQRKGAQSLNVQLRRFSDRVRKVVDEIQDGIMRVRTAIPAPPIDVNLTPAANKRIGEIARGALMNSLSAIRPAINKDEV